MLDIFIVMAFGAGGGRCCCLFSFEYREVIAFKTLFNTWQDFGPLATKRHVTSAIFAFMFNMFFQMVVVCFFFFSFFLFTLKPLFATS